MVEDFVSLIHVLSSSIYLIKVKVSACCPKIKVSLTTSESVFANQMKFTGCLSLLWLQFASLGARKKLGRVNFRKVFRDCFSRNKGKIGQ